LSTVTLDLHAVGAAMDEALGPGRVRREEPLGPLTTYRVGGAARLFVVANTSAELTAMATVIAADPCPVLVIGKGSNLLVADRGFNGVAVVLGEGFAGHAAGVDGDPTIVRAGGAAFLPVLARQSAAQALTGFEWAVGVPGSIGGAVRMNAGGHGSDMAASVRRVEVVDLYRATTTVVDVAQLGLRFRGSDVAASHVVTWAELALAPGDPERSRTELADIVRWRREHQPGGQNAGSVFTNRPDVPAGRLVDEAGAKGLRVGTAAISDKHANFIQADPDGSADDIWALMRTVAAMVERHSGIVLVPETRVVGYDDEVWW
jgi:UDP-N-acetylmuramate dehydrogenase